MKMNAPHHHTKEILTLILTIGVLIVVMLNGGLFFWRLDLTENRAYTISKVSRTTARELTEQLSITYYLSERLRNRVAETGQVADLLHQYAAYSRGRIEVREVDPAMLDSTSQVEALGVLPRQIQVIEQNEQSLAIVYSGIVLSYLDRTETLPFVISPTTLEYEISSAIRELVRDRRLVVGVLIGDETRQFGRDYQQLSNRLQQTGEVRLLQAGEEIPPDVSMLIVLGGVAFDRFELFPIDQYIMAGGKSLFAVDGVNVNLQLGLQAQSAGDLPIIEMLKRYGIGIRDELVLDVNNHRIPVQQPTRGSIVVQTLTPYPYWMAIRSESVNPDHPITARFEGLDLYWASPIDILDEGRVTTIVSSSEESWLVQDPYPTNPTQAVALGFGAEERASYPVGVVASGPIESFFEEIPEREGEESIWESLLPRVEENRIVVIGDTEFLSGLMQYTNSQHNVSFVQNVVGWLANDDDLISIRTRAARDIRLNAIEDPEERDGVVSRAAIFNIFVVPLLVVAYGIVRLIQRRKKSKQTFGGQL